MYICVFLNVSACNSKFVHTFLLRVSQRIEFLLKIRI